MLRRLVIFTSLVCVPLVFYVASKYGELDTVTYREAEQRSTADEGDQAPKFLVEATIVDAQRAPEEIICKDDTGQQFRVEFTGKVADPFVPGSRVRFVGHVHGGSTSYFHATQVYGP